MPFRKRILLVVQPFIAELSNIIREAIRIWGLGVMRLPSCTNSVLFRSSAYDLKKLTKLLEQSCTGICWQVKTNSWGSKSSGTLHPKFLSESLQNMVVRRVDPTFPTTIACFFIKHLNFKYQLLLFNTNRKNYFLKVHNLNPVIIQSFTNFHLIILSMTLLLTCVPSIVNKKRSNYRTLTLILIFVEFNINNQFSSKPCGICFRAN